MWRRMYQLAPTDPRFLAMTPEDILADLLAHQYAAKGTPSEEFEDDDFDAEGMMAAAAAGDDWETLING
jgi:hypothetical protein